MQQIKSDAFTCPKCGALIRGDPQYHKCKIEKKDGGESQGVTFQ